MMHRPDNRFQLGQARHFYHLLLNGQQPVNAGAMAAIVEEMEMMDAEITELKQERDDYRVAARLAETKETAVHIALNGMREERDALREKADALADEVLSGCKGCVEKCHRCPFGEVRLKVDAYKEVG